MFKERNIPLEMWYSDCASLTEHPRLILSQGEAVSMTISAHNLKAM